MKHIVRAGYLAATLLLTVVGATPSLAADVITVATPAMLPPTVPTTVSTTLAATTLAPVMSRVALQGAPTVPPAPQAVAPATSVSALSVQPAVAVQRIAPTQPMAPVQVVAGQPVPLRAAAPAPARLAQPVPLRDLVISYIDRRDQDAEQMCLANAVYFEARSEPLEGQLAVAQVVLNRAASGTFPTSVCEVVTQPAQFSFVLRGGKFPSPDKGSACWHRALAIADIARKRAVAGEIASNVLWYHATYVSPSWGRQRTRFAQIGQHIFFS